MLLDSNIVIYAAKPEYSPARQFIQRHSPVVSAISYLEVLGFHRLIPAERAHFEAFFADTEPLQITEPTIQRATELRQQRRMSLADAIIAGTALVNSRTLVTHNGDDVRWISGLKLADPLVETA